MSVFLETVTVEEAIRQVLSIAPSPKAGSVSLGNAIGRVVSEDILADIDIPGFTRSVVDGYAVRHSDTSGASESVPAMLEYGGRIGMGEHAGPTENPAGRCMYVPTGGHVPDEFDAVAMIEYCEQVGNDVLIKRSLAHGENIVGKGEDFRKGEVVLKKGHRLSPQDVGVLAAVGCDPVPVYQSPRIGIISTGNEVIPVSSLPRQGQVRDVNSYLCGAYARESGCDPVAYGIVRDEPALFREVLGKATQECDAVLISGGSSKDERDLTASLIGEKGEVLVHGIALAPGKPTIIGRAGSIPVIGLPGHPASAFVVLVIVVRHLLNRMTGDRSSKLDIVQSRALANIPSARGREEYVRVTLSDKGAMPVFGKSGLLNTLVRSDGIVRIPAGTEGIEKGDPIEVIRWQG